MAASLREGPRRPCPTLVDPSFWLKLSREDARLKAKFRHAELSFTDEVFRAADLPGEDFRKLLSEHPAIGVYAGLKSWFEIPDLEAWTRSFAAASTTFCYPRSNVDSFDYCASTSDELVKSPPYGLREPALSRPVAQPSLIFVPCTLADLSGHRMGRGKGHFDRYLARHPGTFAVGVCHEEFLLERFPDAWTMPHDQGMDAILTNTRYIKIPNQKEQPPT